MQPLIEVSVNSMFEDIRYEGQYEDLDKSFNDFSLFGDNFNLKSHNWKINDFRLYPKDIYFPENKEWIIELKEIIKYLQEKNILIRTNRVCFYKFNGYIGFYELKKDKNRYKLIVVDIEDDEEDEYECKKREYNL